MPRSLAACHIPVCITELACLENYTAMISEYSVAVILCLFFLSYCSRFDLLGPGSFSPEFRINNQEAAPRERHDIPNEFY
ncbi:hypothetical protein P0136_09915 [Lentisphaerota bacterium ZTH]|nr:hypothetical protein JYG24_12570 [Lentisphaerota bacterium]WET05680.1 hypothetical protein P0136_09915 [Lentisphaerota bacterium ZTH]